MNHSDQYLMTIPCGTCAECQTVKRNEWYYRSYYEFLRLKELGGKYVYYDTLTYDDNHLPHLSDTWTFVSPDDDMSCFDYSHIRLFLQNLRIRLIRQGYSKNAFRYFIASEYGTSGAYVDSRGMHRIGTHRPHYHIMLFIYDDIPYTDLSVLVSKVWYRGRTDGLPYRDYRYVGEHNCISVDSPEAQRLRVFKYVSKYVEKSCLFSDMLTMRLNVVMNKIAEYVCINSSEYSDIDDYLSSEAAHRERLKLKRYVCEFHRQSQGYGLYALNDVDLDGLYENGCLYMPDSDNVMMALPLPDYYKRKLFYELVDVDGARYWQLNEDGVSYRESRRKYLLKSLCSRYDCVREYWNLTVNVTELANYVLNERGRIKSASLGESVLLDRLKSEDLVFNYVTGSDKLQFGNTGLSCHWLGSPQVGYKCGHIVNRVTVRDFINTSVILDPVKEQKLKLLDYYVSLCNDGKQIAYELKQRLECVCRLL